ncbi:MAG: hypothetical protein AB1486_14605 [Planctomycetota bacterium]
MCRTAVIVLGLLAGAGLLVTVTWLVVLDGSEPAAREAAGAPASRHSSESGPGGRGDSETAVTVKYAPGGGVAASGLVRRALLEADPEARPVGSDIAFVVRDPQGAPIRGAVAVAGERGARATSLPAGEDGRGILRECPPSAATLRVAARGFMPAEVSLPHEGGEPLIVTLSPGALLEIVVLDPERRAVPNARVELWCNARLFPDLAVHESVWDWARIAVGQTLLFGRGPNAGTFFTDAEGRALVIGPVAGEPFDVTVKGLDSSELAEHTIAALGPTESRTEEIVLPCRPLAFPGKVIDDNGEPVVGANVLLITHGDSDCLVTSDANGSFRMEPFMDGPLDLVVWKEGLMPIAHFEVALPQLDQVQIFRLGRGLTVSVRVEDEARRPVRGALLSVEVLDDYGLFEDACEFVGRGQWPPWTIREAAPGEFLVEHLPPAEIIITAWVSLLHMRELQQHSTERRACIVFPVFSQVEVHWKLTAPEQSYVYRIALERDDPTLGALYYTFGEDDGGEGTTCFEAVEPGDYHVCVERCEVELLRSYHLVGWQRLGRGVPVTAIANQRTVAEVR